MKKLLLIIIVLFASCKEGKLDKMYVKDSNGNIYQLKWSIGECYFLDNVDTTNINKIIAH